jgi:LmbE family N-acetylglucosaminyl deacetylase
MVSLTSEALDTTATSEAGTSEFAWRQSYYLMGLTELSLGDFDLAVVLAPHPDDETLGLGGTIATLLSRGTTVIVMTASDGESSNMNSRVISRDEMRSRRQNEARAALGVLGKGQKGNALNVQLHLPDGNLAGVEMDLAEHLSRFLGPRDVCFATWEFDGHPDHEAAGRAARSACDVTGARLVQFPVDMWHGSPISDPSIPWRDARRVSLGPDELDRKNRAIACYESQIRPLYERDDSEPLLLPHDLAHFQRSFEVVFT